MILLELVMATSDNKIDVGSKAPDFTLPSQNGDEVRLSDLLQDSCVVLFFYPRDGSPNCTSEACGFRDAHAQFAEAGAKVVGISSDSVASHKRFATIYGLPFTLLSDESGSVRRQYGVPSTFGLIPGRVTFVIDRSGTVRFVFSSQFRAGAHIRQALAVVRRLVKDDASSENT
jgi:peroxiredoxin Q/BCP